MVIVPKEVKPEPPQPVTNLPITKTKTESATPQMAHPTANKVLHPSNNAFLPNISDNLPNIGWKAAEDNK